MQNRAKRHLTSEPSNCITDLVTASRSSESCGTSRGNIIVCSISMVDAGMTTGNGPMFCRIPEVDKRVTWIQVSSQAEKKLK